MDAHHLSDVTVVADAGMISAANQKAIGDHLAAGRVDPQSRRANAP
jgi:hypothetical protein